MLPILLAFVAGVLLAQVVRQLIGHHARDLVGRRANVRPRDQDGWLLPDDEDVIRRSRDLARQVESADAALRSSRGDVARPPEPRRVRERATASPLRGFGVTFRVRR